MENVHIFQEQPGDKTHIQTQSFRFHPHHHQLEEFKQHNKEISVLDTLETCHKLYITLIHIRESVHQKRKLEEIEIIYREEACEEKDSFCVDF